MLLPASGRPSCSSSIILPALCHTTLPHVGQHGEIKELGPWQNMARTLQGYVVDNTVNLPPRLPKFACVAFSLKRTCTAAI